MPRRSVGLIVVAIAEAGVGAGEEVVLMLIKGDALLSGMRCGASIVARVASAEAPLAADSLRAAAFFGRQPSVVAPDRCDHLTSSGQLREARSATTVI